MIVATCWCKPASSAPTLTSAVVTDETITKRVADLDLVRQFRKAHGRGPNPRNLLNAMATFERSLITPRNSALRRTDGSSPRIVRVPSLRNVAATAPYFHDGSAPTLQQGAMCVTAASQPDSAISMEHAEEIAAVPRTLTGTYRGCRVGASQ